MARAFAAAGCVDGWLLAGSRGTVMQINTRVIRRPSHGTAVQLTGRISGAGLAGLAGPCSLSRGRTGVRLLPPLVVSRAGTGQVLSELRGAGGTYMEQLDAAARSPWSEGSLDASRSDQLVVSMGRDGDSAPVETVAGKSLREQE